MATRKMLDHANNEDVRRDDVPEDLTLARKFIMPKNADVFLLYGPYESCWITDYRTKRLEGLIKMLTNDGHSVKLKQLLDLNVVQLWVNGELVFSCDITDLNFGGDGELDELCHQAVINVRDAF